MWKPPFHNVGWLLGLAALVLAASAQAVSAAPPRDDFPLGLSARSGAVSSSGSGPNRDVGGPADPGR